MDWRRLEHHAIQTAEAAVARSARVAGAELTVLELKASALRQALEVRNSLDPHQQSTKADQWAGWARIIYDRASSGAIERNHVRFAGASSVLTGTALSVVETPAKANVIAAAGRAARVLPQIDEGFLTGAGAARAWMLEPTRPAPPSAKPTALPPGARIPTRAT